MKNRSCGEFVAALASSAPVPGGGGAAALCGALAAALGSMVGQLTVGKKKYAEVEAEIIGLNERAVGLAERFLQLIDADAAAFAPLAELYSVDKNAPGRAEKMELALRQAAEPPMEMLKASLQTVELAAEYAEKGSVLAVSDAGCSAALCQAAAKAAALNVYINTKAMKNRARAEMLEAEAERLCTLCCARGEEVYRLVERKLRKNG